MQKILVIDDQLDNLISIKALVSKRIDNCEIHTALSGNEGLQMAQLITPDLIILDIQMPGMDGYEVCKEMKKNDKLKRIPILMLTAFANDSESKIKGLEVGADNFLTKPIDPQEIIAHILVLLRMRKSDNKLNNKKKALEKLIKQKEVNIHDIESDLLEIQRMAKVCSFRYEYSTSKFSWTNEFFKITGLHSREKITIDDLLNVIHPLDKAYVQVSFEQAFATKKLLFCEFRLIHLIEGEKHITCQGFWKQRNIDGVDYEYYTGYFQDISQNRVALDLMQEASDIVHNVGIGLVIAENITKEDKSQFWVVSCNPEIERIFNKKKSEISNHAISNLIFSIPYATLQLTLETVINTGASVEENDILLEDAKQGNKFLNLKYFPLPKHQVGISVTDVTSRLRLINEMERDSEFRQIRSDISNMILDGKKTISEIAAIICNQISIFTKAELVFVSSVSPQSNELNVVYAQTSGSFDVNLLLKRGVDISNLCGKCNDMNFQKHYPASHHVSPCMLLADIEFHSFKCFSGIVQNEMLGQIGIGNYSTELFTDKDFYHLQLIANIFSMGITRVLHEYKLVESKNKAEESDRLKTSFLSNLSHEVRTPLNGVIGFVGLLENPKLTPEKKSKYLNIIRTSADQLLYIFNDLIELARLESDTFEIRKSEVPLNNIMNEIYQHLIQNLNTDKKNLDIRYQSLSNLHEIYLKTDMNFLRSVIVKLLQNAIKFTLQGFVEFGYSIPDDENILFYVKDTGIGIDPEHHQSIFDKFRQEVETYTREFGGLGIGLTICKLLIEKMSGNIWVESTKGEGSTFYFTIPYQSKNATMIDYKQQDAIDNINIAGKRCLIVDDVDAIYLYLSEMFLEFGVESVHAKSGEEGIAKYEKGNFDFVLMDVELGDMNGYDVSKKIKSIKEVPILIQTAYAITETPAKAKELGCDGFVTKPIDWNDLFKKVNLLFVKN